MEKQYWERFQTSGRVEDYLYYKGMNICNQVMQECNTENREQVGENSVEPINNGDRYSNVGNTDGGIR